MGGVEHGQEEPPVPLTVRGNGRLPRVEGTRKVRTGPVEGVLAWTWVARLGCQLWREHTGWLGSGSCFVRISAWARDSWSWLWSSQEI